MIIGSGGKNLRNTLQVTAINSLLTARISQRHKLLSQAKKARGERVVARYKPAAFDGSRSVLWENSSQAFDVRLSNIENKSATRKVIMTVCLVGGARTSNQKEIAPDANHPPIPPMNFFLNHQPPRPSRTLRYCGWDLLDDFLVSFKLANKVFITKAVKCRICHLARR